MYQYRIRYPYNTVSFEYPSVHYFTYYFTVTKNTAVNNLQITKFKYNAQYTIIQGGYYVPIQVQFIFIKYLGGPRPQIP